MASEFSIKGYEIIRKVGEGGMAEVYLARQVSLDRKVVIKKIISTKPDITRIRSEGIILSRLSHPNIVTVYDLLEDKGEYYLVEEFLEGMTLREYLDTIIFKQTPMNFESFKKIAEQIIEGVESAHAKGIIHRDLKPENIIILDGERVKICDFGISSFESQPLTTTYKIAGTLEYMPPELFDDHPRVSILGDYYSLGCIFYEMLTLKKPFGFTEGMGLLSIIKRKMKTVPDFEISISDDLGYIIKIIRHIVSIVPEDRSISLLELKKTLKVLKFENQIDNGTQTRSILGKTFQDFIHLKEKFTNNNRIGKINLDKINPAVAIISFIIAVSLTLSFLTGLIATIAYNIILRINNVFTVLVFIFMIISAINLFIGMILGIILIQNKKYHGIILLGIPVLATGIMISVMSDSAMKYSSTPTIISFVIILFAAAFYFYLWYYYSKLTRLAKPILKITLIIFIGAVICFGIYSIIDQVNIYSTTRLTYENLRGTWRLYKGTPLFEWVFLKNNIVKMFYDENDSKTFESKEETELTFEILQNNQIIIGDIKETAEIKYPHDYTSYDAENGFNNGRALIFTVVDENGDPERTEFREVVQRN